MIVSPVDNAHRFGGLMRQAQDGDRAAYHTLLTEIVPLLRRSLRRRHPLLCEADREDIVQDILLAVHTARAAYDGTRPFLPWLMAIAHNRSVDATRRHGRRSAREVTVAEYSETLSEPQTNIDGQVYGDPEALRQAMHELPKGQRTAIELVKLREMSLKEAATASGMSVGALKVAAHRATRALRLALKSRSGRGY
jgi:RNA polymerase sigma factor (sigma-70 family)